MDGNSSQFARRVAVLSGGESAEREVSLASGQQVALALSLAGHQPVLIDPADIDLERIDWPSFDVCFIALHGGAGEDGRVQTVLEQLNVPYTGSNPTACLFAMCKSAAKERFHERGVSTLPFVRFTADQPTAALYELKFPLVIKPDNQGSSLGVNVARNADELRKCIADAAEFDSWLIAEPFVAGREFTVSLLGRDPLPMIEIVSPQSVFTYDAKYASAATEYHLDSQLLPAVEAQIYRAAIAAAEALGTAGLSRVDLMLDGENRVWVLEMNTIPGMTAQSFATLGPGRGNRNADARRLDDPRFAGSESISKNQSSSNTGRASGTRSRVCFRGSISVNATKKKSAPASCAGCFSAPVAILPRRSLDAASVRHRVGRNSSCGRVARAMGKSAVARTVAIGVHGAVVGAGNHSAAAVDQGRHSGRSHSGRGIAAEAFDSRPNADRTAGTCFYAASLDRPRGRCANVVSGRIEMKLTYRRPVAMVAVYGGLLPIDAEGVLLPTEDFTPEAAKNYPRVTGVTSSPLGPLGTRWGDLQVEAAAKLSELLLADWPNLKIHHISVQEQNRIDVGHRTGLELVTRAGTKFVWGSPIGEEAGDERAAAVKLQRLKQLAGEANGLDGAGGIARFTQVIFARQFPHVHRRLTFWIGLLRA